MPPRMIQLGAGEMGRAWLGALAADRRWELAAHPAGAGWPARG